MILLAPRIGNVTSYVTLIIDDIDFAWQAQYLLSNEYICCHLPICSPNNVPQTHYPLEDGSLVTHATSWNARMQ